MNNAMEGLHHELLVLSKAVSYKNMSTAADNIGLSQPQISRIISRLESELDVPLLNRNSKRNAYWTEAAQKLSSIYKSNMHTLSSEISQLIEEKVPKTIRVATLEGLVSFSCEVCHSLLQNTELETLELNVFDLSVLEERFEKSKIDLAFTSREPGHRKFRYNHLVGHQTLEKTTNSGESYQILSTYEQNLKSTKLHKKPERLKKSLVSNSLHVRRYWLKKYGGTAMIPSKLIAAHQVADGLTPVLLLAQDSFNHTLWNSLCKFANFEER